MSSILPVTPGGVNSIFYRGTNKTTKLETSKPIPNAVKYTLSNGIPVLLERIEGTPSAAVGILVKSGSAGEALSENGISHLIEHLTFKGTPSRSAFEILEVFDSQGGVVNARTSEEQTEYFAFMPGRSIERAIEVLADMFLNSSFDPAAIEIEKGCIIEEIKMHQDHPMAFARNFFMETMFPDHPLGREISGTKEMVAAFERNSILAFLEKIYHPDNLIISAAGNFLPEKIYALLESNFGDLKGQTLRPKLPPPAFSPALVFKEKPFQQTILFLGAPGLSWQASDRERFSLSLLNNILGGSGTSRLFQKVRTEKGLVYAINSSKQTFSCCGLFSIFAAMAKEKLLEVYNLILAELQDLKTRKISLAELQRSQGYLIGSNELALESAFSRMKFMQAAFFQHGKILTLSEMAEIINSITPDDILSMANRVFNGSQMTLTAVGPFAEGERPVEEIKI